MAHSSMTLPQNAKSQLRITAYGFTQTSGLIERVVATARHIWAVKPVQNLALRTKSSPRTAERWCASEPGSMSADALANLIRTEDGFRFLCAVMDGANPIWWRLCMAMMTAADVRKMQRAAHRKLRRLVDGAVDADRNLSLAQERAENALAFQDEDFMRPHINACNAMAGAPNRTVDKAGKVGRR